MPEPPGDEPLSTQPIQAALPSLAPRELLRWAWRQLTSMRTALMLLFLLALAATPGSLLPQRGVDPAAVSQYAQDHPRLAPILDTLQLFDVFGSVWFSAIYLLLVISLAGCIIPRTRQHWKALRSRPPTAPRHLSRLPARSSFQTSASPEIVLTRAHALLRRARFRVVATETTLAAEKGYLREAGNLLFHLALLGVLLAVAVGSHYGFTGSVLVVEGEGFTNTPLHYDTIQPGRWFDAVGLPPFSFTLTDFAATYQEDGEQRGAARTFHAVVDYRASPQSPPRSRTLQVNRPLDVDGMRIYLLGHGYAPVVTVRDGRGEVAFSGPVPCLPLDSNFSSTCVIKAPDSYPEGLAFTGFFLPTMEIDRKRGPISTFPDAKNPSVFLLAYQGDEGVATSVYRLNTARMQRVENNGQPVARALTTGQTMTLPDGLGSLSYSGYREWATFQVRRDPGRVLALVSAGALLVGLMLSLSVRRRRMWVRVSAETPGNSTVVEVGGLARSSSSGLDEQVARITERIQAAAAEHDKERHGDQ